MNPIKERLNDPILRQKAWGSFTAVSTFLLKVEGKEDQVNASFGKLNDKYLSLLDLAVFVPIQDGLHDDLILSFVPKAGGGARLSKREDGKYTITLYVPYRNVLEMWNRDFVRSVHEWFVQKKGTYVHEFMHYLNAKRFSTDYTPQTPDVNNPKAYYNDPEEVNSYLQQGFSDVEDKMDLLMTPEKIQREFGRTSREFINTVFKKYLNKEFTQNLSVKNRTKVYKRLYDFYLDIQDRIQMKKLNVQELKSMIRKEVKRVMENKGAAEWKSIDDMEKPEKWVPDGKEKKSEPVSLKDLMGMGGKEVMVKPEEHLPKKEKDSDKTQLEPIADEANESYKPSKNNFLLESFNDDPSFRF